MIVGSDDNAGNNNLIEEMTSAILKNRVTKTTKSGKNALDYILATSQF